MTSIKTSLTDIFHSVVPQVDKGSFNTAQSEATAGVPVPQLCPLREAAAGDRVGVGPLQPADQEVGGIGGGVDVYVHPGGAYLLHLSGGDLQYQKTHW